MPMQLCYMQDRGALLEKAVRASGMKITVVAKLAKMSRNTLYAMFKRSDISVDELLEFGKILKHDFIQDLKDVPTSVHGMFANVNSDDLTPLTACRQELDRITRQLNETYGKYINTLETLDRYRAKYGPI